MFSLLWPILLCAAAGVLYNITARSHPSNCHIFATLIITYATATFLSFVGFLCTHKLSGLIEECAKTNWVAPVLGIAMLGLEVGAICIYRAGWKVSVGALISHVTLAVALFLVGVLFYKENISFKQCCGILLCLSGLVLLLLDQH